MKLLIAALATLATPAIAQEPLRDFCGDRPGIGTPACTVDAGHLQIEAGLGDWTLDRQKDSRTDTITAGTIALRYGVGSSTEIELGWTGYGHVREHDRVAGSIDRMTGVGDVTLGLKQNLANPAGDGLSIALLPFVSIPAGGKAIGAGDWGGGMLLPIDYELNDAVQLQFTGEVDAAVDQDRDGRHLAYSGVIGIDIELTEKLAVDSELQLLRDRDPSGHQTQAFAAVALEYMAGEQTQLDLGTIAGLNHNAPDVELYFGISRKF